MKLQSLHDLYVSELRDLYSAEIQILKALPKFAEAISSLQLRQAVTEHVAVTRAQVDRLERIFKQLGKSPKGRRCLGMVGILKEGQQAITDGGDPDALDAALIVVAQKVEHYEMAGYGSVRTFAGTLGDTNAHRVLQELLEEEADADRTLTALAEDVVNVQAVDSANGVDREAE